MNNQTQGLENNSLKNKLKKLQLKEVILFSVLAILLLFAAWKVFGSPSSKEQSVAATETEKKLVAILETIDGVGEVELMVTETEDGKKGVVVVCDGAKDIRVLISVREAVATALGTEEKNVKIYMKKD